MFNSLGLFGWCVVLDLIFHILIPLGLLALFGLRNKWVFLLLPLTIILDLGTPLGVRRGIHSIFVVLLILGIIYLIAHFKSKKDSKIVLGISAFYLFSHLLLDLGGPMALLWPFSSEAFTITIKIMLKNMIPVLVFNLESAAVNPADTAYGTIVSEAGFGLAAIFLIILIARKKFFGKGFFNGS